MREIEIHLTLRFKIPETGFNVNGLLHGLKESNSIIMLTIVQVIFKAIEKRMVKDLLKQEDHTYSLNGHQRERTLKTSFGDLKYSFVQLKDNRTNKTLVPLIERLAIPKYKRYLDESLEPAIGLAVHLSYGRSEKETSRILDHCASRWTVWRRLKEFSDLCQFVPMKEVPYTFLMVDGTQVHLQERRGKEIGHKELRWAFASQGVGQPFDIVGIWIDKSWEHIASDLKERLDYDKIEALISDGDSGIENLLTQGMRHQRCIFHGKRDFPFMLYADKLKKPEQEPFKNLLYHNPVMTLSNKTLERLSKEDRIKVKLLCEKTESDFKELIQMLDESKYPTSRTYIENLSKSVSLIFYWWLEKNEWIPFTSNIIENRFSQVKNRIKRIGRRWSDTGLLKWLLVAVKKIFTPLDWDSLWSQFLDINKPLTLVSHKIEYRWIC